MLQQLRLGKSVAPSGSNSPGGKAKPSPAASGAATVPEEKKQGTPNTSKSPFRSSNTTQKQAAEKKGHQSPGDDDIEEDIVQDHEDIRLEQNSARDPIAASGGASSAVGIDQSIDTLRMEEFDWVEEVKYTPRGSGIDL